MPKVVRTDLDELNAVVTVTLEKSDIEPKLDEALQKFRKKAALKGFRPGKTPMSMVRKMYGNSVLADVVNDLLSKELYGYIYDNKLEILGQPLPTKEEIHNNIDAKELSDLVFKFDLGIAPQFEIQGLSAESQIEKYVVELPESMLSEELNNLRKRLGNRIQVEDSIIEGDALQLSLKELEGDGEKEGGIEAHFSVLVNDVPDETLQKTLLSKKQGDTLQLNPFLLHKDDHHVRHHLLHIDHSDHDTPVGERFEARIEEVNRVVLPDLDQAFFDEAFGADQVHTEAEALDALRKDLGSFYDKQADALFFRDFQDMLMKKNPLPMPDGFLKRWLRASNPKLDDATVERDYPAFARNLQWTLLKNKLTKQFNIEITEEAIKNGFRHRVSEYFGAYGMSMGLTELVDSTVERLMGDEKQVNEMYEDLLVDQLIPAIKEVVNIVPKPIEREAFLRVLEEARAQARAKPSNLLEEEE